MSDDPKTQLDEDTDDKKGEDGEYVDPSPDEPPEPTVPQFDGETPRNATVPED